jgi:hypothetical protein
MYPVLETIAAILCSIAAAHPQVESRSRVIESQRQLKAEDIRVLQEADVKRESAVKEALHHFRMQKIFERFNAGAEGFRIRPGGLPSGAGLGVGPEFRWTLRDGAALFRAAARGSLQKAYLADMELRAPKLFSGYVFADLYAARSDYPQMRYYGPGPSSALASWTDYRLERSMFGGRAGVRPIKYLKIGIDEQYLLYNVGPGTAPGVVSTEQRFSFIPGVSRQSNFIRTGPFLQFDYRDNPGAVSKGGNYILQYAKYSDQDLHQFSFNRLEAEVQQYIPFFNKRRVIVLRGKAVTSEPHSGQAVPFYLQPALGGKDDLRGFAPFRFYDNNSLVLTGEYRFDVITGLRFSVFADAGKVASRWQQLNLTQLAKDYGFGLRSNLKNFPPVRVDFGFSGEGARIWINFDPVF